MRKTGTYSIDRIEGDRAVLVDEVGDSVVVALTDLPDGVGERDVLRLENGVFTPDAAKQQAQIDRITALQDRLRKRE